MSEQTADTVASIIQRYAGEVGMLIPMMQDIQTECGYLPQAELKELSGRLVVPLAQIYSVATFYSSFRLMPKGDHTIQLCMGTVCFLKGADKISEAIQQEFELVPGGTSPDGKFTFSPVNCVGACALAPVMVVDGQYHGGLDVDGAVELLRKVSAGAVSAGEAPSGETAKPKKAKARKPKGKAAGGKRKKAAKSKKAKGKSSGSEEASGSEKK